MKNKQKVIQSVGENWWGIYDMVQHKLLYVYEDEMSAINQLRRGASNWILVPVGMSFDLSEAVTPYCCWNCNHK